MRGWDRRGEDNTKSHIITYSICSVRHPQERTHFLVTITAVVRGLGQEASYLKAGTNRKEERPGERGSFYDERREEVHDRASRECKRRISIAGPGNAGT